MATTERLLADLYLREVWSGAALARQAAALRRLGLRDDALSAHLGRAARRREGLRDILKTLGEGAPPRGFEACFRAGGSLVGTLTGRGEAGRILRAMDSGARSLALRYGRALGRTMPPEVAWRLGGFYRDVILLVRWLEERIIFPDASASPLKRPDPPDAAPP